MLKPPPPPKPPPLPPQPPVLHPPSAQQQPPPSLELATPLHLLLPPPPLGGFDAVRALRPVQPPAAPVRNGPQWLEWGPAFPKPAPPTADAAKPCQCSGGLEPALPTALSPMPGGQNAAHAQAIVGRPPAPSEQVVLWPARLVQPKPPPLTRVVWPARLTQQPQPQRAPPAPPKPPPPAPPKPPPLIWFALAQRPQPSAVPAPRLAAVELLRPPSLGGFDAPVASRSGGWLRWVRAPAPAVLAARSTPLGPQVLELPVALGSTAVAPASAPAAVGPSLWGPALPPRVPRCCCRRCQAPV